MLDCSILPQKTDPQWLTARLTAMAQVVAPQTDSDLRGLYGPQNYEFEAFNSKTEAHTML